MMMKKITVIFADDHQIITNGMQTMIQDVGEIELLGVASDGEKALNMVKSLNPDVLITDISMPCVNGIELTSKIQELGLETKVLVLTMYTQGDLVYSAINAGAKGVISKQETTGAILVEAINKVYSGEEYFSPAISATVMKSLVSKANHQHQKEPSKVPCLTTREKEILKLFVEGFSNQEIADKLFISIRTVETHKNNIMQKFNFKSSVEMVKFALVNNLVMM